MWKLQLKNLRYDIPDELDMITAPIKKHTKINK